LRRAVNKGIAEMREIDGKKTYGLKHELILVHSEDGQEAATR
jgi:hypothetical protein